MKTKFLNPFIIIVLILVAFIVYNKFKLSGNSHFTVTADTVIKPNSEISKYVTQEEVDEFAFTYWDIYDENGIRYQEPNATLKILRDYLEAKDTNSILKFLKDNNLSVDVKLQYNTTPLMYSSFHDDENTTKALINLGANVSYKDKYGLNPLAYAVENNSTKTAKILVDNGAKFEDIKEVQNYLHSPVYGSIKNIIIDNDSLEIIYTQDYATELFDAKPAWLLFHYIIRNNFIEIAEIALDSGYKPQCIFDSNLYGEDCFKDLTNIPNHEPMLNLLLDHNVSGQPSEELLKKEYDRCYKENYKDCFKKENSCRPVFEIYDEIRALKVMYKLFKNYCPDKNGTFKNTKEFIAFKNEDKKEYAISSFKNKNPEKVFIKDKNMTLDKLREYEYKNSKDENERNFIKTYYLKTN